MSNFGYTIQVEPNHLFPYQTDILLNKEVIHSLGIPERTILIGFGKRSTTARVGISTASKEIVLISRSLAERLLIPFNCTLNLWYSPNQEMLELGPILGILVPRVETGSNELFGPLTSFCNEALEAAKIANSLCYVTTLDKINVDSKSAIGWTKIRGDWKEIPLPIPNAFYNRLSRSVKDAKLFQQIKEITPVFNDRFLNKWQVYQLLSNTPLAVSIPDTSLCSKVNVIQSYLSRYPVIFLKPVHGSQGKGIIRIRRTERGFIVEQTSLNGLITNRHATMQELIKRLSLRIRKLSYIVQQGIPLIQSGPSSVDFRVLVQKNRLGEWRVTSLVARTGNPNTFVSNLAQGGTISSARNLLSQYQFINGKPPTTTEIKQLAVETAAALEKHLQGYYGEFGIDFGIDPIGRIWLIEINSKPSKGEDTILNKGTGPRPSVIHLFDYVHYLAGIPNPQPKQIKQKTRILIRKTTRNRR